MHFTKMFLRTLLRRPGPALASLYWRATGRKVRARNRLRLAAVQGPHAYEMWIEAHEHAPLRTASDSGSPPRISILLWQDPDVPAAAFAASLASVTIQATDVAELIIIPSRNKDTPLPSPLVTGAIVAEPARNAAEALRIGLARASGAYVLPLAAGDRLGGSAISLYRDALTEEPALVYADEDTATASGRRVSPWFKPRWNAELFLAQDYVSHACIVRAGLAREAIQRIGDGTPLPLQAILLSIVQNPTAEVRHIPHVLCHRRAGEVAQDNAARVKLVDAVVRQSGGSASAGPFDTVKVSWPLPARLPLVSIVVPTKDKAKLLRACVESVRVRTAYSNWELIIVDNGSSEPAALRYLADVQADPRIKVLRDDSPYNYSAINNRAVSTTAGEYICLLNNDTEVVDAEWLTEMMRYAVRPEVGAVGAKLLYPDGSIQHAGVVVGLGEAAGHAHRFLRAGHPGYFNLPHVAHYVSAVTAACLVVERKKFDVVGGLDAEHLAIAFNDVDLCLKLGAAGWRSVYTPHARLIHHESKSRGKDISARHIRRYRRELEILQRRWNTKTYVDPMHHPNLDRSSETYLIRL